MSNKVWKLMYFAGATERMVPHADNPQTRKAALDNANAVAKNGWRVWVEHQRTSERIFESEAERAATALDMEGA